MRPRLPVEFAQFAAGLGLMLFFFGSGAGAYAHFNQGDPSVPLWTLVVGGAGLGLLISTAAVYFLGTVLFVRQRGVKYDSFFWDLPLESPDHPEDAGEQFDGALDFLLRRWPHLALVLVVLPSVFRVLVENGTARSVFNLDLGPVHEGGTHWAAGEIAVLGGGAVFLVYYVALAIRRVWAMQDDGASKFRRRP